MSKEFYISKVAKPIGKSKMIILTLPPELWEKFNALVLSGQQKIPGITHDMIVSTWAVEMLNAQPEPAASTVEAERKKLEDGNGS
jgi:hypothetical protein